MRSVICTLFEGSYHYGVAALANSLYNQGYKGEIYAGYRGLLPNWCNKSSDNASLFWPGAKTFTVADDLKIHLLPLSTDYHFTNYKPDFMLSLWDGPAKDADALYYFDPDIIVTQTWSFFEEWVSYGVALCEDVNSPLSEHHPRRTAWRNHFKKSDIILKFKEGTYANGGFAGVSKEDRSFLETWKNVQDIMAPLFGGLSRSVFQGEGFSHEFMDYYYPFSRTDQDALNAAAEAFEGKISFIGQEAMAFKSGPALMPHALGPGKPWNVNLFLQLIYGHKPRLVDREYWKFAKLGPVNIHSSNLIRRKIFAINIAAFFGRFYSK